MKIKIAIFLIGSLLSAGVTAQNLTPALQVERIGTEPIIDAASFAAIGASGAGNINGPSCIRVPDWVAPEDRAHPDAQYYLYFANHSGESIRMAWAVEIEGPWHLFNMGSNDDPRVAGNGVLDLGPSGGKRGQSLYIDILGMR